MTTFADWLSDAMARRSMSLHDLALAVEVSPSTVHRWRAGTAPKPGKLRRLAAAMNVDYPTVARLAGYMPGQPEPDLTPEESELLHLYRQVDPGLQAAVLELLRFRVAQPAEQPALGPTAHTLRHTARTTLIPSGEPAEGAAPLRNRP